MVVRRPPRQNRSPTRNLHWRNSTAWEVFLTVGTGFLAFTSGSLARQIITGTLFAITVMGLLADVVGRLVLRWAVRGAA